MRSQEEIWFNDWCEKALEIGVIKSFKYEPVTFALSEPVKGFPYVGCEYTPDFVLVFNVDLKPYKLIESNDGNVYVDTKGDYMGNRNKDFSVKKAWMFKEFGIYVNKVTPKFYKNSFGPNSFLFSDKTGKRLNNKMVQGVLTLGEWIPF